MKNKYLFLLTLLVIHSSFIDLRPLASNNANLYVQMLSCIFLLLLLGGNLIKLFKRYKALNIIAILLSLSYAYSTYRIWNIHTNVSLMSPYTSILQFLKIISVLALVEYVEIYHKRVLFLKYFLVLLGVYLGLGNIDVFSNYRGGDMDVCIIGDKFVVSYLNLFWISLYIPYMFFMTKVIKINKFRILLVLSCFISYVVSCSTGIVVGAFMLVFSYIPVHYYHILYKPLGLSILILILDLSFFFLHSYILDLGIVKYIVVDVLGEDLTLTTRTNIWAALLSILSDEPLWGYGPGNETVVVGGLLNLTNAQNGLLHTYLGVGAVGVFFFLLLLSGIVRKMKLRNQNTLFLFLLGLVVASIVEVSLSSLFLCYSSFLLIANTELRDGGCPFI